MARHPDDLFERAQREFERMFQDIVYRRQSATHFFEGAWQPAVDLMASADHACVRFEISGVARQDIKLQVQDHLLTVWGRRRTPREDLAHEYHRAEIFYGAFERTVELPWPADPRHVKAHYRDGMLEVRLVPLVTREGPPPEEPR